MRRTRFNTAQLQRIIANAQHEAGSLLGLRTLDTVLQSREGYAGLLGVSFNEERDYYKSFGWRRVLTLYDYLAMYERNPVGARVVDAPPDGSWRSAPKIEDEEGKEGSLSKAWKDLDDRLRVCSILHRADKLTGVGQYGIVYLIYNDGLEPDQPVGKGRTLSLVGMQPLSQVHAEPQTWELDRKNERYGMPLTYRLTLPSNVVGSSVSVVAHYSRVLHICENMQESNVYGTPRLQRVFNYLHSLDMVAGASAEMFWQGAFRGSAFLADPEADMDTKTRDAMTAEIEDYVHKMKRYIRLQGVEIHDFPTSISNPSAVVDVILTMVSVITGMPKRILQGSERGELSSAQDEVNWIARLNERREQFCEPIILRPLISKLMEARVLPAQAEYHIDWPELAAPSEGDKADLGLKRQQLLSAYVQSGLRGIMKFETFLREIVGFSEEQSKALAGEMNEAEVKRVAQEEKDAKAAALAAKHQPVLPFRKPGEEQLPPSKKMVAASRRRM